jgi:large subunit ribosomal protein L21
MYANIETGGKQYRVKPGEVVQIEKIAGDVGSIAKFGSVLLAAKAGGDNTQIWLGKPALNGGAVEGEIVGQGRGDKITIVKMKRRKQYRRTQGHRQELTQVLITSVSNGAGEKLELSADDKKNALAKFSTQLRPKGPAFSPKRLGSRKRLGEKIVAMNAAGGSAAGEKKTAKKTPAKKA